MSIKQIVNKNSILLLADYAQGLNIDVQLFDPHYLASENLTERILSGRGKVYFFRWSEHLLALRNYYRGGAIAKISTDKFIYTGIENTRCYQELSILSFLMNNQISVPKPIAAIVHKRLFTYRASILTEVIKDAVELDSLLAKQKVDDDIWHQVGREIRKMHNLQVCHYDLNVKNILVQGNKVFLIDFDKCYVKPGDAWKAANIERLKRSLAKQRNLQSGYQYTEPNFEQLLAGYKGDID